MEYVQKCVFIVNFEHIFRPSSSVFIVDFEQVMFAGIVRYFSSFTRKQKCVLPTFQSFKSTVSFMQKPSNLICSYLICFQYEWNGGLKWHKNIQSLR